MPVPSRLALVLAAAALLASCAPGPLRLEDYRLVDLTHTFDEQTLYWPTDKTFEHNRVAWGVTEQGHWYSSFTYGGSEHGGTHMDAPIHFAEGKPAASDVPLDHLIGPAVVIDISTKCEEAADYLLTVEDIEAHERGHGRIEPRTIVLIHTGWHRRWPDARRYLGSDTSGDTENLHFPGVSAEAAEVLVQRGVRLVGIDTASIDHGPSRDFRAHQVFAEAEVACLENVARLNELPPTGAILIALPMKIGEGSGAPCRIVALVRSAASP
jgi:kynurenine formamidase